MAYRDDRTPEPAAQRGRLAFEPRDIAELEQDRTVIDRCGHHRAERRDQVDAITGSPSRARPGGAPTSRETASQPAVRLPRGTDDDVVERGAAAQPMLRGGESTRA